MIAFGELRKLSVQWRTDVAMVERVYALDWLLKGIFDRAALRPALALRGAAALSKAYLPDYPQPEDADFALASELDAARLEGELHAAAQDAARVSGLQFRIHSFERTEARVEYTGPLGRRSAAQPHIPLRFHSTPPRLEPLARPLLHPFSDRCDAMLRVIALEAILAECLITFSRNPRARDVFDLWFILAHSREFDAATSRALAENIAAEKGVKLRAELDPARRAPLERAWDNALKSIPSHPPFAQAQVELEEHLRELIRL
jgi:predicted nucleotidyltransferase component of viral defense system